MKPSTELLIVMFAFAVLAGLGARFSGPRWDESALVGAFTGLAVFLFRYVDGDTVVHGRTPSMEARVAKLERQVVLLTELARIGTGRPADAAPPPHP